MQIVINMHKDIYKDVLDSTYPNDILMGEVLYAVKHGVVLPEHHGKLKDYGYIVDAIDDWYNACEHRRINGIDYLRKRIDDIPTVLEGSDKE